MPGWHGGDKSLESYSSICAAVRARCRARQWLPALPPKGIVGRGGATALDGATHLPQVTFPPAATPVLVSHGSDTSGAATGTLVVVTYSSCSRVNLNCDAGGHLANLCKWIDGTGRDQQTTGEGRDT